MKTTKIILIGMLCTFLVACNTDDDDNNGSGGSNNGLKTGQVEIKADMEYINQPENIFSFYATAKKISIDWGDGTVEEFTPNGAENKFQHKYSYNIKPTVTIETESLTNLSFVGKSVGDWLWGTVMELRFGKCTELKEVYINNYTSVLDIRNALASLEKLKVNRMMGGFRLLSLDVSGASKLRLLDCKGAGLKELNIKGCTSLTELDCSHNQLSTTVLNKIFNDLPTVKSGEIYVNNNLELNIYSSCDWYIARNKGWASPEWWMVGGDKTLLYGLWWGGHAIQYNSNNTGVSWILNEQHEEEVLTFTWQFDEKWGQIHATGSTGTDTCTVTELTATSLKYNIFYDNTYFIFHYSKMD